MAKMFIVNTSDYYFDNISGYEYTAVDIPLAAYNGSTYVFPGTMASELLPYGQSLFIATKECQSISSMTDYLSIHWKADQWVTIYWHKDGETVYSASIIPHDPWTIVYEEQTGRYGLVGYGIRDGKYGRYIPNSSYSEYITELYDFAEAEKPTTAETPTITTDLELFKRYTYEQGDIAETLTVEAEVSDGGTLTYQWLRSGTDVDPIIPNATESSYTPPTDQVCSRHYQCQVKNTNAAGFAAYTYSNFVIVDVVPAGSGDSGDTGDDPEDDTGEDMPPQAAALADAFWRGFAAGCAV